MSWHGSKARRSVGAVVNLKQRRSVKKEAGFLQGEDVETASGQVRLAALELVGWRDEFPEST